MAGGHRHRDLAPSRRGAGSAVRRGYDRRPPLALRGDAAAAVVLAGTVRRTATDPRSAAVAAMWDNANRILDA